MGEFDGMAEYRHQREFDAPPLSTGRVAGLAVLTIVGLVAGCVLINATVTKRCWRPPLPRFDEVVAELEVAKDRVDLVFLGPSHMMTDIDPRIFDARAGELGYQVRSYNYSVEGLRISERDYLLEQLKRMRPGHLKYVLVKPDLWLNTTVENAFSTRARYFNTPESTRHDLALRLGANRPLWTYNAPRAAKTLLGALCHLSNVGVISDLILPPKGGMSGATWENHPERQGYVPLVDPHRKLSRPDDAPYPVLPPPSFVPALSAGEKAELAGLFQEIRDLGAQPVVVIPPVGNENLAETDETLQALEEAFADVPTLTFHASGQSPDLYRKLGYWEDLNHLSVEGSQVFSRLLAERFTAFARAREDAR